MKRLSLGLGLALSLSTKAAFAVTIYLTSGTTWTVPQDWNSQDNKVEVIGHGGRGGENCPDAVHSFGGGAGGYSATTNVSLAPGSSVGLRFDVPSFFTNGITSFQSTPAVTASNGADGNVNSCSGPGQGGQASAGVGATKFSGGNGGSGSGGGSGTGSGGGAAGPHGAGATAAGDIGIGGAADAGFGGAGGTAGGPGGNGTELGGSHGAGGGASSLPDGTAGVGGNYGGGGGFNQGGGLGLIVITYTPHKRISSGAF